jgi:DNA-binding NtrC family response regulator
MEMKWANLLLIDFNPAGGLCGDLSRILDATSNLALRIQHWERIGDSGSAHQALESVGSNNFPDLVFLVSPRLLREPVRALLHRLKRDYPLLPLILVTETGGAEEIFDLLELGVADFVTPPLKPSDLLPRIWRLVERTRECGKLEHRLKEKSGLKQLIGESEVFLAVVKKIPLIARCDAGVLLLGETGTGKELCARAIHYLSSRASFPFVPVNCGAIPTELAESELFGHERGAFTDAVRKQEGVICQAEGGSLFLDEIDSLSLAAQVKLLRFLQDKEYRPLGAARSLKADVRIIAAANVDPEEAVKTGKLRQDLYYRLNIIPLRLPPLRERREDIPLLARHFLAQYTAEFGSPVRGFSTAALQRLRQYDWPGNVRELENLVARAVALAESEVIESDDLNLPCATPADCPSSFREAKAQFERAFIEDLLLTHQGNITRAAQTAHKNRRAFWELIRKHHINVNSFKPNSQPPPTSR